MRASTSPNATKTLLTEISSARIHLKNVIWANVRRLRDHPEPSKHSQAQYDLELNSLLEAWRALSEPEDVKGEKEDLAGERKLRAKQARTALEDNLGWAK